MNRVWPKVVITERNEIYRLCEDIYSQWAHELKNVLEVVLVCSFGFVLIVSLSTYFDNRGDKPHTHGSETRFIKI